MGRTRDLIMDGATLITAVVAIGVGTIAVTGRGASENPFAQDDRRVDDFESIAAAGHRTGSQNPILTIVEFGDFECPACRGVAGTLKEFLEAYPDDVRLVYRHWPLENHSMAYSAARASECAADQGRFWEFHYALYETEGWKTRGFAETSAIAGVPDLERFEDCAAANGASPKIEADIATIKGLEGWGTPSIIANGLFLGDMVTTAKLEDLLDDARR